MKRPTKSGKWATRTVLPWLLGCALTSACLAPEFRIAQGSGGGSGDGSGGELGDGAGGSLGGMDGDDGGEASGSAPASGGGSTGGDSAGGGTGSSGPDSGGGSGSGGDGSGGAAPEVVLTGIETVGEDCPASPMPAFASLPTNAQFPDPFTFLDETPVTTRAQWMCRHRELSAMIQHYETGQKHPKPADFDWTFSDPTLWVHFKITQQNVVTFSADIAYPSGPGPFPAMIVLAGTGQATMIDLGVATISIDLNQFQTLTSRTSGIFSGVTGDATAGAFIAWSWGVSRLLDALEVVTTANIDTKHVGVSGCSRFGKAALLVGAMDARIALTIAQESGAGGVATWRAAEYENDQQLSGCTGSDPERCTQKLSTSYGSSELVYSTAIEQFDEAVDKLPFDHHELIGLVAPRGLLAFGNSDVNLAFNGRYGSVQGMGAGREIYRALAVPENIGFVESAHVHCGGFGTEEDEALEAFVRRFLLEEDVSTEYWSEAMVLDAAKWVDWTTPTLD